MSPLLLPFQLVLLMFAGWVTRHQLDVIEYLQEENRVLKERLGGRRLRFTDSERRRQENAARSRSMPTWWSRAVNRSFFCRLARSRTRASPGNTLSRLGVRRVWVLFVFP